MAGENLLDLDLGLDKLITSRRPDKGVQFGLMMCEFTAVAPMVPFLTPYKGSNHTDKNG